MSLALVSYIPDVFDAHALLALNISPIAAKLLVKLYPPQPTEALADRRPPQLDSLVVKHSFHCRLPHAWRGILVLNRRAFDDGERRKQDEEDERYEKCFRVHP